MKGNSNWNYRPYLPANRYSERGNPFICRLAPRETDCEAEWLGEGDSFTLCYSLRGQDSFTQVQTDTHFYRIENLQADREYELYVVDYKGRQSPVRLIRTGECVGTIVNYLHPEDTVYGFSGQYLCSPSIIRLPGGSLLASMDVFRGNAPQNLQLLFGSDDGGGHWHYVTDIFPCFWGKLFWHQEKLFMLGVSREYGDLLIGCSEDLGRSWGTPTVILRGSSSSAEDGNHRAPMCVLHSHGSLWTGTEYGSWHNRQFYASLLSIEEGADPMVAANWSLTEFVHPDVAFHADLSGTPGGIEGNAVELPDGKVVDFLRYEKGKALLLEAAPEDPEAPMTAQRIVDFPLGHTKFDIERHTSGVYYACGNPFPGRTVLALYSSRDFVHWKREADVINRSEYDIKEIGFQYPSICFDGDDILILSRTAWNCPHNFHDSNFITFHRLSLT